MVQVMQLELSIIRKVDLYLDTLIIHNLDHKLAGKKM